MPKQRTSGGDATGRKREQLQKEHAEELKARGDEISLAQAEEDEAAANGVFDPESGQQIARSIDEIDDAEVYRAVASASLAPGTRQVGDPQTTVDDDGILYVDGHGEEFGVQTNDTPILGVGQETPFQVVGGVPNDELVRDIVDKDSYAARRTLTNGEVQDLEVAQARNETKVIRVNTTLEEVTIGVGTSFNFEEGKQYRVPAHVAAHLEEKGYIWH
jgi:hypothetical protein